MSAPNIIPDVPAQPSAMVTTVGVAPTRSDDGIPAALARPSQMAPRSDAQPLPVQVATSHDGQRDEPEALPRVTTNAEGATTPELHGNAPET
ncbi:MAG: hypothetical protein LC793_12850, partial [Thermomicrobia bacterium]|nr:hypothetical protein [Thermomicrobia bacterium]